MATPAENLLTAYEAVCAEIASVASNNLKPDYTINGVSLSWASYLRMLREEADGLREQLIKSQGPYEVRSYGR